MENSSQSRKLIILFAAVAVMALLAIVLIYATGGFSANQATTQTSSSSSIMYKGGMGIQTTAGARETIVKVGDTFKLAFVVDIEPGAVGTSVAEIILNFAPEVVSVAAINESENLLALNKSIDNTQGIVTVDIANIGGANFANGTTLVEITFTAKAAGVTEVKVAEGSTLGVPNILDIQRLISTVVQVQ